MELRWGESTEDGGATEGSSFARGELERRHARECVCGVGDRTRQARVFLCRRSVISTGPVSKPGYRRVVPEPGQQTEVTFEHGRRSVPTEITGTVPG